MTVLRQLIPLMAVLALGHIGAAGAQTIKKCQDADGKWHYGDFAAEQCEQSRITEIDDRGLKVREREVPPTQEEIRARDEAAARLEEERRELEAQRLVDQRLLSTYESPEAIVRARDERLEAIQTSIHINEDFLARLQQRRQEQVEIRDDSKTPSDQRARAEQRIEKLDSQIRQYEGAIESKMQERSHVKERYGADLERYRELLEKQKDS